MLASQSDCIVHAATGAPDSDSPGSYSGLGQQILEGNVDIARPSLRLDFALFFLRQLIVRNAAALAETTIIDCEGVYPQRSEALAKHIPQLALLVALVQQQDSRSRFSRRKIRSFQQDPIG